MSPKVELKFRYLLYTVPALIWIIPMLVLVVANPFWFRQAGLHWFSNWMDRWFEKRQQYLKPYVDKTKLFDYVKGTAVPKNNIPGRPKFL